MDELHMVSPPEEFVTQVREQLGEIFQGKNPIDSWYRNQWHDQYPNVSILLTLGMIRLSQKPAGSFGAMLTFEKR
jgi:hypothetical protein